MFELVDKKISRYSSFSSCLPKLLKKQSDQSSMFFF